MRELKFTNSKKMNLGTIYCVASNYSKHAAEMGTVIPSDPSIFIKPPVAYLENGGTIVLPDISDNVHHEVELIVVIGEYCNKIHEDQANKFIAGYGIGIDVTLRDIQSIQKKEGKPWSVSKGFVNSAPVSVIVPKKMYPEENPVFDLELRINGQVRQKGSTNDMERNVNKLIEFLSSVFTLEPGDLIFTGTPEGVGQIKKGDKISAFLNSDLFLEVLVN